MTAVGPSSGPSVVHTGGAKLWAEIEHTGKVEETGWDAELVATVKAQLQLPPDKPLIEGLRAASISAESFLRAFLVASKAYVDMWGDLLALMERAGAHESSHAVAIEYHFGDDQPKLRFDIDHFRRAMEITKPSRFDLRDEDLNPFSIASQMGWANVLPRAVDRWSEQYHAGTPYPTAMPPTRPRAADIRLDALFEESWALGETVLAEVRETFRDRPDLDGRHEDTGHTRMGTPIDRLYNWERDFWLESLIRRLYFIEEAQREGVPLPPDLVERLDATLAPFRNQDPLHVEVTRELLELLDLPLWTHRAELFSNWVCTQVITALEDQDPRIHTDGDAIRFSATGTMLATFDAFDPPLLLCTELQTPLASPRSEKRKAHIRPDISIVVDPIADPASTRLVIECKQFKKPDYKLFADALADYANGRPEAAVALVDHGKAQEPTAFKHLGDDAPLADRLRLIASLAPGNLAACGDLTDFIRTRLGLDEGRSATPDTIQGDAEIRLRWTAGVDLDLHVTVTKGTRTTDVSYGDFGSIQRWPFVQLSGDVRTGGEDEVVTIVAQPDTEYVVTVVAFTSGSRIGDAGAEVILDLDGDVQTIDAPDDAETRWHVITLRTNDTTGRSGRR